MTIYDTVLNTIINWAIEGSGNYGLLTRNIHDIIEHQCDVDDINENHNDNGQSVVFDRLEYINTQQLARFHLLDSTKQVEFIENSTAASANTLTWELFALEVPTA